ncbi:MAG: GNAT family N-acetyltransferase [Flavobacteriales bacterium]|nr:GNAT family N-acetyltransferase [Flavobacteriales bacterium]
MDQIIIRQADQDDVTQLKAIAKQTFLEAFAADNTAGNMERYLRERLSEQALRSELATPGAVFHFAEIDGRVVGYLKVNTGAAQTEPMGDRALEIERIYVLKEFHGQRVGQVLFEKAMALATAMNAEQVWLGVWERNPRAIAFYRKNGFEEFGRHLFRLGDDEQTDILMRRML